MCCEQKIIKQNERYKDKFRGCLIGGAIGDALGYPVEFLKAKDIFDKYGSEGVADYILSNNGQALISDDTQMTLFTATGLLLGKTRAMTRGISAAPYTYPGFAYKTWYRMQVGDKRREYEYSWLADVPELGANRAPGNTCMSVIKSGRYGNINVPINDSKGCGGIMRVAPVGLYFNRLNDRGELAEVWEQAANIAALTHGHELGWLPAAVFAHIINRICFSSDKLVCIIQQAQDILKAQYGERRHTKELLRIINKALSLVSNNKSDLENIKSLGEGWVAEETLAIAIYCSLKYQDDFSKALSVSVNHDGDSDSTGAITGNILGALYGYNRIPDKWKEKLECRDVILEVADDLCHDCHITEYDIWDRTWAKKYIENRRVFKKRQQQQ